MKRIVSIILITFMITSIMPANIVMAESDDAEIQSKIEELYSILGNTYFNVERNEQCKIKESNHGCPNCLTSNIVVTDWFKNQFGNVTTSQFPITYCYGTSITRNAMSCAGFGAFAEWYIFKKSVSDTVNTVNVGTYAFNVENLQKYVKPGDLIHFNSGGHGSIAGHSGICINTTSNGVYILDCNGDPKDKGYYNCRVAKRTFVPDSRYPTFTISRVTNRTVIEEPITYCAVKLNGNGGTPANQTLNIPKGREVSLPTPVAPTGYQFAGWYTQAVGGTYITKSSYTVSNDLDLYAHWSKKSYTIRYDDNGGNSGAPASQQKTHGTAITLSSVVPFKTDYKFLGWSTNSNATVASYQPCDSFSLDADVTLYAVWKALPPTMKVSKTSVYLDYETNKSEVITLSVTGVYDGDYYFAKGNCRGINAEISANKLILSPKEEFFGEETIYVFMCDSKNDSVVAKSEIKVHYYGKYTNIELNANGGATETQTQKVPYGRHILNTQIPEREGYVFLGWSTDKNAIIPEYVVGEYSKVETDMTWYAVWHAVEYTVVVNRDLNGGSGTATKVEYKINLNECSYTSTGVVIDVSHEETPVKDGYIFAGWGQNSAGKGSYTNKLYLGFNAENSYNFVATWLRTKWTGEVAESFASGDGTEESPYIIETLGQLAKLSIDVACGKTYEGSYFELGNNINMQSNGSWIPIGYDDQAVFKGSFDGKNHTISCFKLDIVGNDEYPDFAAGLFGCCQEATIKNIKFVSPYVTTTHTSSGIGILCGRATDCEISNIYVNMTSLSGPNNIQIYDGEVLYCGGIAGCCDNTIINGCTVAALKIDCDIATAVWAGGIAGTLFGDSKVKNSQALSVKITGNTDSGTYTAGGIVGEIYDYENAEGLINNCLSDRCNITIKTDPYAWPSIGGIVGVNNCKVTACISTNATLIGEGMFGSYVGGIAGSNEENGQILSCMSANISHTAITNSSQMEADYEKAGHIVAKNEGYAPANFNYYKNTTKNTAIYTDVTGTSLTEAKAKKLTYQSRVCSPFSSIESYENGGTLWILEDGEYPSMYNTAEFYFVTAEKVENGSVSVSSERVLNGEAVDITVKPDCGYHLVSVYANDTLLDSLEGVIIRDNTKIKAEFELDEQPIFTMVTGSYGNGSVSVDKTQTEMGETVTVTATPDEGFEVESIFVDGVKITGNSFVVSGNNVIDVEFTEKNYTVSVIQSEGGTIKVDKTVAKYGEVVELTAIANDGYRQGSVLVNGTKIDDNYFTVSSDSVVECSWIKDAPIYSVEVVEAENGEVIVSHSLAEAGTTVSIEIIPDYGYETECVYLNDKIIETDEFVLSDNSVVTAAFREIKVATTGVSFDQTTLSLDEGEEKLLIATIEPLNATNQNVTWTSSNEKVATVVDGIVTAKSAGVATITVTTDDGGFTADCTVTVTATVVSVTGISLNKPSIAISVGGFEQLAATVAPSDATDKTVIWSCNDESVAMVSTSGFVVGVGVGTAVIIAKTNDGNHTAFCVVTVSEPTAETPAELKITLSGTDPLTVSLAGELSGKVIVALYNDDDNMVEVQMFNAVKSKTVDFKNSGSYAKVMWVEDLTTLEPKCEAKTKTLK